MFETKTEYLPVHLGPSAKTLDLGRPLGRREGQGPMLGEESDLLSGPLLSLLVGADRSADVFATGRGLGPPALFQDTQSPRKVLVPREVDEGREEFVRVEVRNCVLHDGVEDAPIQARLPAVLETVADLEPRELFVGEGALSRLEEHVDRVDSLL